MDFILNPFVTLLTFLYSVFGNNMVLAIVVFTIAVRFLTYPLTVQQLRSSQAMQKLQPELKKLQEKHKNDREKLAQEQMQLYREYGVNPVGGCLPLLIQFPIFIGLYQAIIHALAATPTHLIDLSGRLLIPGLDGVIPMQNMWLGMDLTQPPNLAAPFPTLLIGIALPVLTMVTTWLQFKLTMPTPQPAEDGKPNQMQAMTQSMTTIMPLMYGFFALSFSVGLSIYFVVSNLVGIAQYTIMGRANYKAVFGFGPEPRDLQPRNKPDSKALPAKNESKGPETVSGRANSSRSRSSNGNRANNGNRAGNANRASRSNRSTQRAKRSR
ncbi:MAG: YidC/Oxa1 family membrane protein insertase [Chloroflexi bacterium]|nr:YidC/Oxa1 family membrane protein insertase [Chloroflexota bacterium]